MNNDLLNLVRGTSIPAFITQNRQLQDIASCMPEQSRRIVRTAFACKPSERQQTYEQLKKQYAEQSESYLELGPRHYEAMMLLIDWMLPQAPIASEEEDC